VIIWKYSPRLFLGEYSNGILQRYWCTMDGFCIKTYKTEAK
jgi:hypothetical protein